MHVISITITSWTVNLMISHINEFHSKFKRYWIQIWFKALFITVYNMKFYFEYFCIFGTPVHLNAYNCFLLCFYCIFGTFKAIKIKNVNEFWKITLIYFGILSMHIISLFLSAKLLFMHISRFFVAAVY